MIDFDEIDWNNQNQLAASPCVNTMTRKLDGLTFSPTASDSLQSRLLEGPHSICK